MKIKEFITKYRVIPAIWVFLGLGCGSLYSQYIFPEQFGGCNTDRFALEGDSISVKSEDKELVRAIVQGFDKNIKKDILGLLAFQILVDMEGNSCLLSVENGTRYNLEELMLKKSIDENLKWVKPVKKLSPLVSLKFYKDSITVTRTGVNSNTGFHTLKKTVLKREL